MCMPDRLGDGSSCCTQPGRKTVDRWLSSFWKRHFVLTLLPCLIVWVWVAIPFPVSDPYKDDPFPDIPSWPKRPKHKHDDDGGGQGNGDGEGEGGEEGMLPLDVNFYFFLFWYYGYVFPPLAARSAQEQLIDMTIACTSQWRSSSSPTSSRSIA